MLRNLAKLLPLDKIQWEDYFISLALIASARADCSRRQYGAVLVSNHRVIATGYNSPPPGVLSYVQCEKLSNTDFKWPTRCCKEQGECHGSSYDVCNANHAEMNCLTQIGANHGYTDLVLYVAGRDGQSGELIDTEPCIHCARLIQSIPNLMDVNCLQSDETVKHINAKSLRITSRGL